MSNPAFLDREVQEELALRSVNPGVYERIQHYVNLRTELVHVLGRIMNNPTPHRISNVDVVSRRKGRVTARPWTDRSLDIEFPAPGGQVRSHSPLDIPLPV